jgi:sulfur-oxidizing protein SoxY
MHGITMRADIKKHAVEPRVHVLARREFMVGGAAATVLALMLRSATGRAETNGAATPPAAGTVSNPQGVASRIPVSPGLTHSPQFEKVLQAILADAEPVLGGPLTLELPELAENGNVVPYTLAVESPMTDADYVRTLHLLSSANPQAAVAKFHLIPATGKASVSGRMRLAKTQDVVAVAELFTGPLLVAVRKVEVTIGGCGNE